MQQPIKRKKVIKFLNKICQYLPEKTYQTLDKLSYPQYQDAFGQLWGENDDEETRRMVWHEITTHTHNPKRLCLHLYDRWGIMAVNYYFNVNGLQINMDGSVTEIKQKDNER